MRSLPPLLSQQVLLWSLGPQRVGEWAGAVGLEREGGWEGDRSSGPLGNSSTKASS